MSNDLSIGNTAPDFTAATDSGEIVSLSDLRGKKVVLYFYPKDDTPGCTTQACGFRDNHADFEAQGAVIFGISPQGEVSHAKFRDKYDLPFTLLVDEDHAIADAYGVWGEKKMYGRSYMGVTRSHFVIDKAGKIVDAQVKISPKNSPTKALVSVSG